MTENAAEKWDDARYKKTACALIGTIGSYAENLCRHSVQSNPTLVEFFPDAARYIVSQASSQQHQLKVDEPLKLGGKIFHGFLEQARFFETNDAAFKPVDALIKDLGRRFETVKSISLDDYQKIKGVDAVGLCLDTARNAWCADNAKKIFNAYKKLQNT